MMIFLQFLHVLEADVNKAAPPLGVPVLALATGDSEN